MMNREFLLIFLLIFIFSPILFSQTEELNKIETDLVPLKNGDKWGYVDGNNNVVIGYQFDECGPFREGFARVKFKETITIANPERDESEPSMQFYSLGFLHEGRAQASRGIKHGFIDETGELIIDFRFDDCRDFHEGLAAVKINHKWGYIDADGDLVIPCVFDEAYNFTEGLARVKRNAEQEIINRSGETIVRSEGRELNLPSEGIISYKHNSRYGYLNSQGEPITECIYDEGWSFSGGFAVVKIGKECFFIDKEGKRLSDRVFERVDRFSNGFGKIYENNRCGLINEKGEIIMEPGSYRRISSLKNGLFEVQLEDYTYTFINEKGERITGDSFKSTGHFFSEDLIRVEKEKNRWGYMDSNGVLVLPAVYSHTGNFKSGMAIVELNYRYGIIDKEGKWVLEPRFDSLSMTGPENFIAGIDGYKTVINIHGEEILKKRYDDVRALGSGDCYALIQKDKWCYIDKEGLFITEPQFDFADDFSGGYARVGRRKYLSPYVSEDYYGFINRDGDISIPLVYRKVENFIYDKAVVTIGEKKGFLFKDNRIVLQGKYEIARPFKEGMALVRIENTLGFMDKNGRLLLLPLIESLRNFSENLAAVKTEDGWGFSDRTGFFPIKPAFEEVYDFSGGFAAVKSGGKWGVIDASGVMVLSPLYDQIFSKGNGIVAVKDGGQWGLINLVTKREIVPFYDSVSFSFSEDIIYVKKDDLWGVLSGSFHPLLDCSYENVFKVPGEDIYAVKIKGLFSFISGSGQTIIEPRFEEALELSNGMVKVKERGMYGVVDGMGRCFLQPQYESLSCLKGNYIYSRNKLFGVIDSHGEEIVPPEYDEIRIIDTSLFGLKTHTAWALYNPAEDQMTDFIFDNIGYGVYQERITIKQNNRYGYADTNGQIVIAAEFEEAYPFYNQDIARVRLNGRYGFIDVHGNLVIEPKYTELSEITEEAIIAKDEFKRYRYLDPEGNPIGLEGKSENAYLSGIIVSQDDPWWKTLGSDTEIDTKLQIQIGNSAGIICVQYSSDGKYIITGNSNDVVSLWDASTLVQLRIFSATGHELLYCGFSPDSRFCYAVFQDDTVDIWDTASGKLVMDHTGVDANFEFVTVSKDARFLMTGTSYWLRLKDLFTGLTLSTYENSNKYQGAAGFETQFSPVCLSPDSRYFVWGGTDSKYNNLSLFDTASGEKILNYYGHTNNYAEALFDSSGCRFFSASFDRTIRQWDLYSAETLTIYEGQKSTIKALKISPDGRLLLSNESIWDVETGNLLTSFKPANDVDFSPDGDSFVAGYRDTSIAIHSLEKDDEIRSGNISREKCIDTFTAGKDDRYIVTRYRNNKYVCWDRSELSHIVIDAFDGSEISCLEFLPHSSVFLQGQTNGRIFIRDLNNIEMTTELKGHEGPVTFIKFLNKSNKIFTGSEDGYLIIWNRQTGTVLSRIKNSVEGLIPLYVKVSADEKSAAVVSKNRYKETQHFDLWDLKTEERRELYWDPFGHMRETHFYFSRDSRYLIYRLNDRDHSIVYLEDPGKKELIMHYYWYFTMHGWYQGKYLLISRTGSTKEDPLQNGYRIEKKYYSDGHSGVADNRELAQKNEGVPESQLLIVDPFTGKIIKNVSGHKGHISSVLVSPDGNGIFSIGSENLIFKWDLEKEKIETVYEGHDGTINSLSFCEDSKHFVTTSDDSAVRLFDTTKASFTAFIFDFTKNDWLIFTSDGYWDASAHGGEMVSMVHGLNSWNIDQFAVKNNRPDLIIKRLELPDSGVIAHYYNQYLKRLRRLRLQEEDLSEELHVPDAEILEKSEDGKYINLKLRFSDSRYDLSRYNIFVNDVPLFGAYGKDLDGQKRELTETIELTSGDNKVEVSCMNEKGAEAYRALTYSSYDQEVRPDLYFIGFGVSRYRDGNLNLEYADKDVQDLAAMFAERTDTYRNVYVHAFTNEEATVEAVEQARGLLKNARPDDTLVLFIAGHGVHDDDPEATYYYLTHETDLDNLSGTAANFDLLENILQGIAPRNKLFLMDTCESGEIDETMIAYRDNLERGSRSVRARGIMVQQNDGSTEAPSGTKPADEKVREYLFERDRYIYNDLLRRSGTIVFSSCKGGEYSYEDISLKNGFFTYKIKEAIGETKADSDGDGRVTTEELQDYVSEEVAGLSGGLQNPTVDRDNIYVEFGF